MKTGRSVVMVALAALIVISMATHASAEWITMTSGAATVEIDPETPDGVFNWTILETSHLSQQWFWIRTDMEGLYDDREYSLDEISEPAISQPADNIVELTYDDERIRVEVRYVLVGGPGLLSADLAEIISITNLTDIEIEVDFFQYSDFDLGGTEDDGFLTITGGHTATQSDVVAGFTMSETVVGRNPELSEVAIYSSTLDKLQDGLIDDLDGSTHIDGPADLTWAFQWQERAILPNEALVIGKDKLIEAVPEPSAAFVLVAGLAGLVSRKRRK